MASKGQTRLKVTHLEAQLLEAWLRAWQPTASPGLLSLVPEEANKEAAARRSRLHRQFSKITRRRRRHTGEFEILVRRDDIGWITGEVTPRRSLFGRSSPPRSYLSETLTAKLVGLVERKKGRPSLSRAALEAGGFGSDVRQKWRLKKRLGGVRLTEEWFDRRRKAGQSTGLLGMLDPDDPFPNLP